MRRRTASSVLTLATVLGALALLFAPPATARSPIPAVAEFRQATSWEGGYQGAFTITNVGSHTLTSWTVSLTLPADTVITTQWDSVGTRNGNWYSFSNQSYNGTIAPGASVTFGWVAQGASLPRNCTLNQGICNLPGDTTAPTVPQGVRIVEFTGTSLLLAWSASADDRDTTLTYEITRDGLPAGSTFGVTSQLVTGLQPATAHVFRVRAKDAAGNTSAYSAPLVLPLPG
ncbi:cellulose binding domain-containing protein [Streptomyces albipurpureus]|uniref:Cellulose binding domain-containing protein n=1 Tax=Streptomyces albipurpureus TaxID=2897419 RepID=A0ABT0UQH5_9ACTN|nr:cellulose binding domain-containing protein [Streptomyces sp. CWNU-1]MCM2390501.1 cellulose binding domain-containing protein [Streptomyces sp. CWNU-1]